MASPATEQAPFRVPTGLLGDIDKVRAVFEEAREKANLVGPIRDMSWIPNGFAVSFRAVVMEIDGADTYRGTVFCSDHERALTKVGIQKILNAAAITTAYSLRTDRGDDPLVASYQVAYDIPQADGTRVRRIANKHVDLRPGSPQRKAMRTDRQADAAATTLAEMCESKAANRVGRESCALQQKYTLDELRKPFVCAVLVFQPDMDDEWTRRLWNAQHMGAIDKLFGGGANRPALTSQAGPERVEIVTEDAEIVDPDTGEIIESGPANMPDFPDLEPAAAQAPTLCACPCEHAKMPHVSRELTPEVARATAQKAGHPLCRHCYPVATILDYEAHKHLADLGIDSAHGGPKSPKVVMGE